MITLALLAPVVVPVLSAVAYALAGWRRTTTWISGASAVLVLVAATAAAVVVVNDGPHTALTGLLRVDALSAFMLVVIAAVALLATAATPDHFHVEIAAGRASSRTAARHCVLV